LKTFDNRRELKVTTPFTGRNRKKVCANVVLSEAHIGARAKPRAQDFDSMNDSQF
jgi:hypothetical protein